MKKQNLYKIIGENGCYFLALLNVFDLQFLNPLRIYRLWIDYGFMSEDCTVLDTAKIAEYYGRNYKYSDKRESKVYITEYEYKGRKHFVCTKYDVEIDSLDNSEVKKYGKVKSYRNFFWGNNGN